MLITSPAVRTARRRPKETCRAWRPSVHRQPCASARYMSSEGISMTSSAAGPSIEAASAMRAGPMCQTSPRSTASPKRKRAALTTKDFGRPGHPAQGDPEEVGADRREEDEEVE